MDLEYDSDYYSSLPSPSLSSASKRIKKTPKRNYTTHPTRLKEKVINDLKKWLREKIEDRGEDVISEVFSDLIFGVSAIDYKNLIQRVLSDNNIYFEPSPNNFRLWQKKLNTWAGSVGRPETRGGMVVSEEHKEKVLQRIRLYLSRMKRRCFPTFQGLIIPYVKYLKKKSGEPVNGEICSKHWWFDFMEKHKDIKALWEKLPRLRGAKASEIEPYIRQGDENHFEDDEDHDHENNGPNDQNDEGSNGFQIVIPADQDELVGKAPLKPMQEETSEPQGYFYGFNCYSNDGFCGKDFHEENLLGSTNSTAHTDFAHLEDHDYMPVCRELQGDQTADFKLKNNNPFYVTASHEHNQYIDLLIPEGFTPSVTEVPFISCQNTNQGFVQAPAEQGFGYDVDNYLSQDQWMNSNQTSSYESYPTSNYTNPNSYQQQPIAYGLYDLSFQFDGQLNIEGA